MKFFFILIISISIFTSCKLERKEKMTPQVKSKKNIINKSVDDKKNKKERKKKIIITQTIVNNNNNNKKNKKRELLTKKEAIKIAEQIAQKKGYDIYYKSEKSYIKRFEFLITKKKMLVGFRCYTHYGITKEKIKKCVHNLTKKRGGIYDGNTSEQLWIIHYTPWFNESGHYISERLFTVVIGAETGKISIKR